MTIAALRTALQAPSPQCVRLTTYPPNERYYVRGTAYIVTRDHYFPNRAAAEASGLDGNLYGWNGTNWSTDALPSA